jgi:hypothetical protein
MLIDNSAKAVVPRARGCRNGAAVAVRGTSHWAEVLAIEPSPTLQPGPGQVVTGTFRHESSRQLLNITIEGDDQPIGVTDNHPFWSEDRQQFVEACQLEVGETLSTITGTAQITSITLRGPPEPVYNLGTRPGAARNSRSARRPYHLLRVVDLGWPAARLFF